MKYIISYEWYDSSPAGRLYIRHFDKNNFPIECDWENNGKYNNADRFNLQLSRRIIRKSKIDNIGIIKYKIES